MLLNHQHVYSAISGPIARFGIAVVAPGWSLGWLRIADPLHKPLFLSVDLIKCMCCNHWFKKKKKKSPSIGGLGLLLTRAESATALFMCNVTDGHHHTH